jgi:uncharacterized phage protein gp47/JayE
MPFSLPSLETLIDYCRTIWRGRWPGKDDHAESWIGKESRAMAMSLLGFHGSVQAVDNDVMPSNKSSRSGLERHAFTFGLPSGVSGKYGARGPIAASGGVGLCTGTNGTQFPANTQLLAPDGQTVIKLNSLVTVPGVPPGTGSITGSFSAVTKGKAGNLAAGTKLRWIGTPPGGDDEVTLSTGLSGGDDVESSPSLLARLFDRLQKPPKGGTANDYKTWIEEAAEGVTAYIYPIRGGSGTVHAVVTQAGSGTGRNPSGNQQTAANDNVNGSSTQEGKRPITVDGFSLMAPEFADDGLAIRVRAVPAIDKYAFDWSLGASSLTVASYAPGPPGVITTTQPLPVSLKAAVDAGARPRIQVIIAGIVVPVEVRVESYDAGLQTLTLQNPLPAGFGTPSAGNAIHPGGPVVSAAAAALLAYVDSLGPSRQSGYADEFENWEDTCAIARLGQVVLDTFDTDGARMVTNIIAASINGLSVDVRAKDFTVSAPELLHAKSIAVTD